MSQIRTFIIRFSTGILMIFVLLAGFTISVPAVRDAWQRDSAGQQNGAGQRDSAGQQAARQVLTGQLSADFQQQYDETIIIEEPALWMWTALRFLVFRDGLQGVLVGRDGWLFSTEEFTALASVEDQRRQIVMAAEYIKSVRQQLQQHGTELVVVPVPAKARIYPDKTGRHRFPAVAGSRYASFLQELKERSIASIDLVQSFQDLRARAQQGAPEIKEAQQDARKSGESQEAAVQMFLRKDTHWSPDGAEQAAILTADHIKDAGLHNQLQTREFRVMRTGLEEYEGDLLNFLPLGPLRENVLRALDQIHGLEILAGPAPALGLFDTAAVPVVLIGTSYSAGEQWGFSAFLQEQLQAEVLNLATEGRGPYYPMQQYLDSDTLKEAPPVVVIWEIPERYLVIETAPQAW